MFYAGLHENIKKKNKTKTKKKQKKMDNFSLVQQRLCDIQNKLVQIFFCYTSEDKNSDAHIDKITLRIIELNNTSYISIKQPELSAQHLIQYSALTCMYYKLTKTYKKQCNDFIETFINICNMTYFEIKICQNNKNNNIKTCLNQIILQLNHFCKECIGSYIKILQKIKAHEVEKSENVYIQKKISSTESLHRFIDFSKGLIEEMKSSF